MPRQLKKASTGQGTLPCPHSKPQPIANMEEDDHSSEWSGPLTKKDLGTLNKSILSMKEEFSTLLRSELHSFRSEITTELTAVRASASQITQRMTTVEANVETSAETISSHTSEIKDLRSTVEMMQMKCEDLENRSRRSNLRIKALKEGAEAEDIQGCITELLISILGEAEESPIRIERAHRVGPPKTETGENTPRDIIVKLYEYDQKEKILRAARKQTTWQCRGSEVLLFQDIAPATLQRRRLLRPITQHLTEKQIRYRWLFPFGLTFEGYTVHTLEEGREALKKAYGVEVEVGAIQENPRWGEREHGLGRGRQRRARSRRRSWGAPPLRRQEQEEAEI